MNRQDENSELASPTSDASEETGNVPTPPPSKGLLASLHTNDYLIIVCVAALFGPMFFEMYKVWMQPEAPQAYGLLILPAALGLAWMLRTRLKDVPLQPTSAGIGVVGLGLFFLLFGTLLNALTLSALGFVGVVTGIVLVRYGKAVTRHLWFPLAYLLALVPFPSETLNMMTFPLQRFSIHFAALLLRPFSELKIEGTQLHLPNYSLNVIAPCSGLTIVLPIVVLAVYYLYLIDAPRWKKMIILGLTFPVAMFVNAIRVALIGLVGEIVSAKAGNAFHDSSGMITTVLGFILLIVIAREMKCHQIHEEIAL